jgi:hypothetical protein
VLGALFLASGGTVAVIAARHFVRRLAFVRRSSVVAGVVIGEREEREGTDTQTVCYPRVRFRTASGRDITFESQMGRGRPCRIGQAVSVRYHRDRPEIAEFDSFAALWGPTAMFALLAVVFTAVGAALWLGLIPE